MVSAFKTVSLRKLAFGLVLAMGLSLPSSLRADCPQDSDNPPERGGKGSVSVSTTPAKAVVYVGGIKLGPSPVDGEVPSGRHTLTIMLNGEELVNERINICDGQTTTTEKTLLMPYGNVAIKTNPLNINAKVSVDGEQVGSTGGGVLTINRLEAGTRVIKVSHGRRSKEVTVDVLPEQTVELDINLK